MVVEDNAGMDRGDCDVVTIGGTLIVQNNAVMERIRYDSLTATGALLVSGNPILDQARAAGLTGTTGSFELSGLLLGNPNYGSLADVGGDLVFRGNEDFDAIDAFAAVTTVGGDLVVEDNPSLGAADVDTWAAGIGVSGAVSNCGNNGGPACL